MAVARIQIADLYQALREPIFDGVAGLTRQGEETRTNQIMTEILKRATQTTAYKWNKSFRETIDRLTAHHTRAQKKENQ